MFFSFGAMSPQIVADNRGEVTPWRDIEMGPRVYPWGSIHIG